MRSQKEGTERTESAKRPATHTMGDAASDVLSTQREEDPLELMDLIRTQVAVPWIKRRTREILAWEVDYPFLLRALKVYWALVNGELVADGSDGIGKFANALSRLDREEVICLRFADLTLKLIANAYDKATEDWVQENTAQLDTLRSWFPDYVDDELLPSLRSPKLN